MCPVLEKASWCYFPPWKLSQKLSSLPLKGRDATPFLVSSPNQCLSPPPGMQIRCPKTPPGMLQSLQVAHTKICSSCVGILALGCLESSGHLEVSFCEMHRFQWGVTRGRVHHGGWEKVRLALKDPGGPAGKRFQCHKGSNVPTAIPQCPVGRDLMAQSSWGTPAKSRQACISQGF